MHIVYLDISEIPYATLFSLRGGRQSGGGENGGYMASNKQVRLYWVTTADHVEDWFIFAESARSARAYHEHYKGYSKGDAHSRLIVSDVTLKEFQNGTPPYNAQFQDLVGFENAGTIPNRRGVKFNGEIFREGILEAIIELGRKHGSDARGERQPRA